MASAKNKGQDESRNDPLPMPAHLQVHGQKQLQAASVPVSSSIAATRAIWALVRCETHQERALYLKTLKRSKMEQTAKATGSHSCGTKGMGGKLWAAEGL